MDQYFIICSMQLIQMPSVQ